MKPTPELEAMARAIADASMRGDWNDETRPSKVDLWWNEYIPLTRAALLAIREPTMKMCTAAYEADEDASEAFDVSFTAVIDYIRGDDTTP